MADNTTDLLVFAAPVAVVGSRHGSPFGAGAFAAAVVAAGGSVVTGCAAGVDQEAAAAAAPKVRVFRAEAPAPWALAKRTGQVINAARAVAIFPPASGDLGPGSALALRLALGRNLPVFVAGPVRPAPQFDPAHLGGVSGWLFLPPMPTLFW